MSYGFFADAIAVVHFGYVLFVVLGLVLILVGGALGWRWIRNPWFRVLHLAAIAWVIFEHVAEWDCPLTTLEDHLRHLNGEQTAEDRTFVGDLMRNLMCMDDLDFQDDLNLYAHYGVAGLILASMLLIPPRFRRRPAPAPSLAMGAGPLESTLST